MGSSASRARLLHCLIKEHWSSVTGTVLAIAIVANSWHVNDRGAWRRSRVYTEIGAACIGLCTVLLLVGYTLEEESFLHMVLIDTLAMSLVFGVLQYIDNVMFLECAESVGFRIKNPWIRGAVRFFLFLLLFAWFPVYFSRGFTPWYEDTKSGRMLYHLAIWYYAPTMFVYNSVFGIFFIHRLFSLRLVRSSREGTLFVLVLKTAIRIITSTAAIVFEIYMERLDSEIAGSLVYMTVVLVSTHVLFNTKIDGAMERWLFSSYAFFEEMKAFRDMLSPRDGSEQFSEIPRPISRGVSGDESGDVRTVRRWSPVRAMSPKGAATFSPRASKTRSRPSESPDPYRTTAELAALQLPLQLQQPPSSDVRWTPPVLARQNSPKPPVPHVATSKVTPTKVTPVWYGAKREGEGVSGGKGEKQGKRSASTSSIRLYGDRVDTHSQQRSSIRIAPAPIDEVER